MSKTSNFSINYMSLSILIFISFFVFTTSIIKLNFYQVHFDNRNNLQDITNTYLITDDIKIGNPPQNLKIGLEFFSNGLFIIDNNRLNLNKEYISPNNCYYKNNESKTYKEFIEVDYEKKFGINFTFIKNIESIRVNDDVYLAGKYIIKNCSFFLAKTLTETPFGSGFLGLDLNNRYLSTWEYKRFISQIDDIKNENFLISFNKKNNEEGFIYFDLPINRNISITEKDLMVFPQLKKENLLKNYIEFELEDFKWEILINEIHYSDDFKKKDNFYLQFLLNTNIIEGSHQYLEYIKESFFDKYNLLSNNICYIKKFSVTSHYNIYICDTNIEKYLNNFPKLTFILQNHKVEFESKDLFKKCENLEDFFTVNPKKIDAQEGKRTQYVFLIYDNPNNYNKESREFWRIGTLFFKKVDLLFDSSKFKIGMLFDDSEKINKLSIFFKKDKNIWVIGIIILFYLTCYLLLEKSKIRKKNDKKNGTLNIKDEEGCYESKEMEYLSFN